MSGGSRAPNAPDLSGNVKTAQDTSGTATSDANQTFNTASAYNQNAQDTLSKVNGANTPLANQVNQTATANLNQYQQNFLPLQQQQIQQAQNYTSGANVDQLKSEAVGDSNAALQASLSNQRAQLASEGVDPSSVHGSALTQQAAVQGAAANAQAANQSYLNTQQTGMGLVANANQMGLQVGQAGTTGAQAGTGINTQTLANVNSTNATGVNNLTAANPYLSTAMNANQSGANISNTQFQDQMVSQQAQQASKNSTWAGIGELGGIALGEYANSESGGGMQRGGVVGYPPPHSGGGVLPRQAPNAYMAGGPVAHYDGGGDIPFDFGMGGGPSGATNSTMQMPYNTGFNATGMGGGYNDNGGGMVMGNANMNGKTPGEVFGLQQNFANAGNWDAPSSANPTPLPSAPSQQAQQAPQATSTQIPTSFVQSPEGANFQGFGQGFAMTQQHGGGGGMATGGIVSNRGALPNSPIPGSTDTKPAWLTPGEFVIPRDVASWKGHEHWFKQMDKARQEIAQRHGVLPPSMPSNMTSKGQ